MKKYIFMLAVLLMASAEQEKGSDLQEIEKKLINSLENLPTALDPSSLANIEEGEEMFKERCLKNGNNETYENVMVAKEEFQSCVKGLVDFETIQAEIEEAKPKGDLDIVFKKYCRKSPALRQCISNFTEAMEPCLEPEEKTSKNIVMNITDSLVNFICFNEGDRIALFIAEGGPECLTSNVDAIQHCVNLTASKYPITGEITHPENMPQFVLAEEQCKDISEIQKCVVKELEKCSEPTPANIVDSMFNFIRKSTPCSKFKPEKAGLDQNPNSASTQTLSFFTVSIVTLISLHLSV